MFVCICTCVQVCLISFFKGCQVQGYIKSISIPKIHFLLLSSEAWALKMAVSFKAESHPSWLWWVDDSISILHVFPPRSGRGKHGLSTKDSTTNSYDLANLFIQLPVICHLWMIIRSPNVSMLFSGEFKGGTALPRSLPFYSQRSSTWWYLQIAGRGLVGKISH